MTTANDRRVFPNHGRTLKKTDRVELYIDTTTSGAIDTTNSRLEADQGASVARGAAGRYDIQVWKGYKGIRSWGYALEAAGNNHAEGHVADLENVDIGKNNADGTVSVQFKALADASDADVADAANIYIWFELETF